MINPKYHAVVSKIITLLEKNNVWFETFEHEPVRTSEEAAKLRHGYSLHQGAKSLLIRVKISKTQRKFVMLVIPGDTRFDHSKAEQILNAKDLRFATEAEVVEVTGGVQPGGVPPFGNLFELEVIADPTLLANEKIIFNAGDKSFSIAMKSTDYISLIKPRIASIV